MHITSPQNPRIKELMHLKSSGRRRHRGGLFLVEGFDEIGLAISAGHQAATIVTAPELARRELLSGGAELITVTPSIFGKISLRENPDGWLAVFERPTASLEALSLSQKSLLLLMESLEKPGNLGAILRTADAARVDAVLVCDELADVYGPNVVRASRGALFALPVVETTTQSALPFLQSRGIRVVAANPNAGVDFRDADLSGSIAIAMGSEDRGLSDQLLQHADVQVRIPMHGRVNSLNVSVAAALLLYEALRQRAISSGNG
jgi:RNA methyltransferase, TrmH family